MITPSTLQSTSDKAIAYSGANSNSQNQTHGIGQ